MVSYWTSMFLSPLPGLPISRTNESSNGSLVMQATGGQPAISEHFPVVMSPALIALVFELGPDPFRM
jgi:hypothetical protein